MFSFIHCISNNFTKLIRHLYSSLLKWFLNCFYFSQILLLNWFAQLQVFVLRIENKLQINKFINIFFASYFNSSAIQLIFINVLITVNVIDNDHNCYWILFYCSLCDFIHFTYTYTHITINIYTYIHIFVHACIQCLGKLLKI